MSRVWYCANCGYEVDRGGRCHSCKEPLMESSLAELAEGEADEEVGYRLTDWDDSQRGELIEDLVDGGIRHRFEGDELVVDADDESTTDGIVARLTGASPGGGTARASARSSAGSRAGSRADASGGSSTEASGGESGDGSGGDLGGDLVDNDGETDEATVEALEAMLGAARRLKVDPTDMAADGDLAEAAAGLFAIDHVYGIDTDIWAALGRVTRRLLGALGADVALEDEIVSQAAILCRLLEPIVDPQAGLATAWTVTASALGRASYQPPEPVPVEEAEAPDEDRHEVVYELADWLPEERAQLDLLLDGEGIGHGWEGEDLVVSDADWDRVDVLCADVNRTGVGAPSDDEAFDVVAGGGAGDPEDEAADAERYQALSDLFGAADRLAGDPDNKSKRRALVDAADAVTEGPIPFGMSDDEWWQIRTRAGSLLDSIEIKADVDVVQSSAATLSDLLRGFV